MLSRGFGVFLLAVTHNILQAKCDAFEGCHARKCEVPVRTEAGCVCGRVRYAEDGTRYASYRGVPYAEKPLGAARFKELGNVKPWGDVCLYALEDPPACPQTDFVYGRFKFEPRGQREDCIYSNVHIPEEAVPKNGARWQNTIRKGLPILVFVHEGAWQCGSGLSDFAGPEFLMAKKVMVVTFNYRLNVFGFLSLASKEIPGNQGLRDMVTLLRWVQRNARAFGGDPNNVTLMGHSGGGTAAHLLSLSEATQGLFHKLFVMSNNAIPTYYTTSTAYAKHVAEMFLKEVGINETDPALIHRELVRLPLVKIMSANAIMQYKTRFITFSPVIEKTFFRPGTVPSDQYQTTIIGADPMSYIAMGRGRNRPTLMGFTNNEMDFAKSLLLRKGSIQTLKQDRTAIVSLRLFYSLSKAEISRTSEIIWQKYFKNNNNPTLEELMKYYTDMYFKHSGLKMAEWRAAMGGAPFYMYQFAYDAEDSLVKKGFWTDYSGAAHFDDYLCIFRANSILDKEVFYPPKNDDDIMRIYMVDMVTNFMYCGNPTCEVGNTSWPPVNKNRIQYNYIDEPFSIKMRQPSAEEVNIVKFFDSFDPQVRHMSEFLADKRNIESCSDAGYFHFTCQ